MREGTGPPRRQPVESSCASAPVEPRVGEGPSLWGLGVTLQAPQREGSVIWSMLPLPPAGAPDSRSLRRAQARGGWQTARCASRAAGLELRQHGGTDVIDFRSGGKCYRFTVNTF